MSDGQSKPTFLSSDLDMIKSAIRRRYSVVDRSSGLLPGGVVRKIRSNTIRLRSETTAVRPDPISRDIGRRKLLSTSSIHHDAWIHDGSSHVLIRVVSNVILVVVLVVLALAT